MLAFGHVTSESEGENTLRLAYLVEALISVGMFEFIFIFDCLLIG